MNCFFLHDTKTHRNIFILKNITYISFGDVCVLLKNKLITLLFFSNREVHQSQVSKGKIDSRLVTSTPSGATTESSRHDTKAANLLRDDKTKMATDKQSPPSSPSVKAVVEKSNSVSFILDLNDSLSGNSLLEFPPAPRLKYGTPTLSRKNLQKSRSSSLDKKVGNQVSKNKSLAKCTSSGNFFGKGQNSEKSNSKRENGIFHENDQLQEVSRRLHSTSESSGGTESENLEDGTVERASPNGLAWTVPVGLRHLNEPEEDEYEENLEDSEDSFIDGLQHDLTPLVNLMNASSSSPSDSELSRCGSRAGLTDSDEESSLADGERVGDSLSPVAEVSWVPQVGAGEAMVPSDLVVNCEPDISNCSDQSSNKQSNQPRAIEAECKQALPQVVSPFSDEASQVWSEGELPSSPEVHEM